ncbi:MAG: cupin domain-containing protein [Candidatus Velthaea sp.]|jgi:hypothetical protein
MIAWSEPSAPFELPPGPLDLYQSIQRLEPGAWVAAHTHEGPESGVVLAASLARHENGETRMFAAGTTFCTPGGVVHATGNPGALPAEAITLHVVRAGSAFSTPCACASAPLPQPGSTNPARSIVRTLTIAARTLRARHARIVLSASETLAPETALPVIVTVLDGAVRIGAEIVRAPDFRLVRAPAALEPLTSAPAVLLTMLEPENA